jgi:phospholipid/cholesterol/gamma-HCH transport system permease protein
MQEVSKPKGAVTGLIEELGRGFAAAVEDVGTGVRVLLEGMIPPFSLRWKVFAVQFVRWGADSLPISIIIATVSAMITSFLLAQQVAEYGIGKEFIGGAVASVMVRDLGPVMVALVLAGRVGSSTTAEIGSMKLSEQVDALRSLGVDPFQYLVLPRLVAGLIIAPMVTAIAVYIGVILGYLPANAEVNLTWASYLYSVKSFMRQRFIREGLQKAAVFGFLIATISSYKGFIVRLGAEDLGRRVTEAVVISMLAILIADLLLTMYMK